MSVDSLLAQHIRILLGADALERLAGEATPPSGGALARARWNLTRDLLLHLGDAEAQVYSRMPDDPRAARALSDSRALVDALRSYVERWPAVPPSIWASHRQAVEQLVALIRGRLEIEAREVVALLPALAWPDGGAIVRDEYAAEAWRIRGLIFGRSQLPRA